MIPLLKFQFIKVLLKLSSNPMVSAGGGGRQIALGQSFNVVITDAIFLCAPDPKRALGAACYEVMEACVASLLQFIFALFLLFPSY